MEINIRISGSDADKELSSFYKWLRQEPGVREHATITLRPAEPGPGEMGAAFDIIQLVVDSGFQALNLALAFAAWRSTRASRPKITIEYGERRVAIDDEDPDAVEIIVRALE